MRVVIEIDSLEKKRARKIARRLYSLTGKEPEIRISPTGRGYHFIVRGLQISKEQALEIRRKCSDDPMHIRFDMEAKGKPWGILWTEKRVLSCPENHRLAKFLGQRLKVKNITYKDLM